MASKPKKNRPPARTGIVQMFLDNGKVVFHRDDCQRPIVQTIPKPYQVYLARVGEAVPPAHKFVLGVIRHLGFKPHPARFVWCGWGWELRIRSLK